jgi:tetratricopeptide (TPR) repeat protein
MACDPTSAASLLALAEEAWAGGDGEAAIAFFERAADVAEEQDDPGGRTAAVLGLARGQHYNLTPGLLPVRLHATYDAVEEPQPRARLAAALARCWAYANEPGRARPFAVEALHLADQQDDPVLLADALDAALASHWGPGDLALRRDWAVRLADAAAHLGDHDARLQAQLWSLTVAWEVLDLPRMHRSMRAIEQLAEESPRTEFFAATRRLPLELLRQNLEVAPLLVECAAAAAQTAVIPDAAGMLHGMRGYTAFFTGDADGCAAEAPAFEAYAVEFGVATVRAEAAVVWLGAGRLDKVAEMIGAFTPEVLSGLPQDSDWLLVLQCVLEGALAIRDIEVTAAALTLLAPYAGRSVVNAGAVMWHGVTDDTLSRAYALLGDAEASARHRAAALATYERIGASWWRDRLRAQLPAEPPSAADVISVHLHQQPGGLWLVGREGATFVLPRMRGLAHLHALLSRPDTDLPSMNLVGGEVIEQAALDVLDDDSRRILRARLSELDAELAHSDRPELSDERHAVASYLASATGLGGRHRTTGSHAERARVAVRKAIVAALGRIAESDPWLGRHLRDRVRTGFECRYETDPDHPVRWILQSAPS